MHPSPRSSRRVQPAPSLHSPGPATAAAPRQGLGCWGGLATSWRRFRSAFSLPAWTIRWRRRPDVQAPPLPTARPLRWRVVDTPRPSAAVGARPQARVFGTDVATGRRLASLTEGALAFDEEHRAAARLRAGIEAVLAASQPEPGGAAASGASRRVEAAAPDAVQRREAAAAAARVLRQLDQLEAALQQAVDAGMGDRFDCLAAALAGREGAPAAAVIDRLCRLSEALRQAAGDLADAAPGDAHADAGLARQLLRGGQNLALLVQALAPGQARSALAAASPGPQEYRALGEVYETGPDVRTLSPEAEQIFRNGLQLVTEMTERVVRQADGLEVAASFRKDLSRSPFYVRGEDGSTSGPLVPQRHDVDPATLDRAARDILEVLHGDRRLLTAVTQAAQQGLLTAVQQVFASEQTPLNYDGIPGRLVDTYGQTPKTFTIAHRAPGLAAVTVTYDITSSGLFARVARVAQPPEPVDPGCSYAHVQFTVLVDRDAHCRLEGEVQVRSRIVPPFL